MNDGAAPVVGEFVTETFDYDARRAVTIYVPTKPPQAIAYAGDGQLISQWGLDLEAVGMPPTVIVGVHRTDDLRCGLLRLPGWRLSAARPDAESDSTQLFRRGHLGTVLPGERDSLGACAASRRS